MSGAVATAPSAAGLDRADTAADCESDRKELADRAAAVSAVRDLNTDSSTARRRFSTSARSDAISEEKCTAHAPVAIHAPIEAAVVNV